MATAELETKPAQELIAFSIRPISYEVTKAEIEKVVSAALMLRVNDVNDKAGLDRCQKEQSNLTRMTSTIEKQRVEMKRESLEYGRQVDSIAKELAGPLEKAKAHLQEQRNIVKREAERIAKEAEEKRQTKIRERLRLLQCCGKTYLADEVADLSDEDFASLLAAEQADKKARDEQAAADEAERQRVAEANRVEGERLAKEKAELDRQRTESESRNKRMGARIAMLGNLGHVHEMTADELADMAPDHWEDVLSSARLAKQERDDAAAAERAEIERVKTEQAAAQAKIDAEHKRIADAEAERVRRAEIEKLHAEAAEKARLDAIAEQERKEREAKAAAEAAAAKLAQLEALRPDHEKLLAIAATVEAIKLPPVSVSAAAAASGIEKLLAECASRIRYVANGLVGDSAA